MKMTLENYMVYVKDQDIILLGIDLQNDFGHKDGKLYVKGSENIVDAINSNKFMEIFGMGKIFWTKDFHPQNHCSFVDNEGIWPVHCVIGTWGARFINGLDYVDDDIIILKGVDTDVDSYSAFFDNNKAKETNLKSILKSSGIKKLFVFGIATDYCVKFTVLDALELEFEVAVYLPCCAGVNAKDGDVDRAVKEMEDAGAIIIEE